jgi:hypothetical protein
MDFMLIEQNHWPDELWVQCERMLTDAEFLSRPHAWMLLRLIENEPSLLSAERRGRVVSLLSEAFDQFGDWLGAFLAAELISDLPDDDAEHAAALPGRRAIPNALRRLAHRARPETKSLIVRCLETLSVRDVDADVRTEASAALKQVRRA